MNLTVLHIVLAIVETDKLNKAAEQLNMTQSTATIGWCGMGARISAQQGRFRLSAQAADTTHNRTLTQAPCFPQLASRVLLEFIAMLSPLG